MSEAALRDDIANASRPVKKPEEQQKLDAALVRRMRGFLKMSDARESARRREDRIGGNLLFSNHWGVRMTDGRCAWTVNVAAALLGDKISLLTKNRPIPIIESVDVGDEEGVRLMRAIVMNWWVDQDMDRKLEHALYLSNATRTSAIKVSWDPTLNGGAGGIGAGVVPGWRLILDPRASARGRLGFFGDRAIMPRWMAMKLYPKKADVIRQGQAAAAGGPPGKDSDSPISDQYDRGGGGLRPGVVTINGAPTLTAEGSIEPSARELREMVEVAEVYWRDPRTVTRLMPKTDELTGETIRKVKIGEDGMPSFRETTRTHTTVDGEEIDLPAFELDLEDEMEPRDAPVYPFYRRTTMMLPDESIVDDTAWDFPNPYAYCIDGQPLEGLWHRGCLIEVRGLQTDFNIGMSLKTDNRRFASIKAGVAYEGSDLDQNVLSISPGDVLRVRGAKGTFEWMAPPQADASVLEELKFDIEMMRLLFGLDGVMSGEAQGRVDSAAGMDFLADIKGARLAKAGARMERTIADLISTVGAIAQTAYTEKHAVRVERDTGLPTYERITPGSLRGQFRFSVQTGSQMAWTESARRRRVLEDRGAGLLDNVGAWQQLDYPDWPNIEKRMRENPPQLNPPPPSKQHVQKPPKGRSSVVG